VTLPFDPRTRALLIVVVLAAAAGGAGLMVLGRAQSSTDAAPETSTKPAAPPPKPAPATGGTRRSPAPAPAATVPSHKLPAAIQQARAANNVVVVSLFDPNAKIDDTALREAAAGAELAGTTFVPIDVTKNEVDALNARYGVIQDPAVLVLRPPGDLVFRIDGFADRDTVAQAATNAAT
jgi:hypothetical protein